jgi:tRNA-specific 2-thiouridylase
MRVLVAMSGGVDSSVAAAVVAEEGHDVVGATMKLWGGPSDSGCCSVSDVEDARRVAQQLGVVHHVFNFAADFEAGVVDPYVEAHRSGTTPNPCIECNRHVKFDRFLRRAVQLGFDAVATGHHAQVSRDGRGRWELRRGADAAKDQSYVLYMLDQEQLSRTLLPIGSLTKAAVRERARALGLRTATKPDSQDVCFINSASGREGFLSRRMGLNPGRLVDAETGEEMGAVPAVELVTVGQRRGMGSGRGQTERRYAVSVDVGTATVMVGRERDLLVDKVTVSEVCWVDGPLPDGSPVLAQSSAHGVAVPAVYEAGTVLFRDRQRRVAPGQSVVLYDGGRVLGGGIAA